MQPSLEHAITGAVSKNGLPAATYIRSYDWNIGGHGALRSLQIIRRLYIYHRYASWLAEK